MQAKHRAPCLAHNYPSLIYCFSLPPSLFLGIGRPEQVTVRSESVLSLPYKKVPQIYTAMALYSYAVSHNMLVQHRAG